MLRVDFNFGRWLVASIVVCLAAVLSQNAAARSGDASPEFWEAVARDDTQRVQTLLLRGVDTNVQHPQHGPAIVVAARERSWKTLEQLAAIPGTKVDAPNSRGETALMLAALHGHLDSVRLLVDKGAQVNRSGWAPLHYAAVNGNLELLRYLLEQHAYIDAQSPNRTTPLMMSARHSHTDAVRLLVEAGADPTPRNDSGLDAAGYMQQQGQPEVANWLRERAAEFARRYGTLERPRSAQAIEKDKREEDRRRPERVAAPRLPGARD